MYKRNAKLSTTKTAIYLLRFNVALQIAVLAILINLLLAIFTFYFGLNSLYCAFGTDCIIGVLTAIILVWRFATNRKEEEVKTVSESQHIYLLSSYVEGQGFSNKSKTPILCSSLDYLDSSINTDDPEDHLREMWSTFWLGQIMIISGLGVVVRTVIELVNHATAPEVPGDLFGDFLEPMDPVTSMRPLYNLALISLALNLVLMCFKIFVYIYLGSNSMLIEGVNSFISAIFAAVAVISIEYSDSVQYLDQTVSIMFGLFLIFYGTYNVLHTLSHTLYRLVKDHNLARRQGYTTLV